MGIMSRMVKNARPLRRFLESGYAAHVHVTMPIAVKISTTSTLYRKECTSVPSWKMEA